MEKNGNYYIVYWGYTGMMENGKENDNYYIVYGDFIGIMEKKMETGLPRTKEKRGQFCRNIPSCWPHHAHLHS